MDLEAYTVSEAVAKSSISRSQLYIEMNSGRLRYVKVGKRRLILPEDLRDWLRSLRQEVA